MRKDWEQALPSNERDPRTLHRRADFTQLKYCANPFSRRCEKILSRNYFMAPSLFWFVVLEGFQPAMVEKAQEQKGLSLAEAGQALGILHVPWSRNRRAQD